ncbi:NERD domain-containing protein [Pseudobutyrivibrio sp.]|uniref:NERD domain-containing protein n=1 Tax=Pseudobutyrivibrio sp. TaxID=2014367 RepID=UPI0025F9FB46|nr:NERD domain-containing protein [Pseudobutyrivibrio sp.]
MAIMYPKNIHVLDAEDSEIEVYNQLRDQLDDSFSVFYSVEWNRKRKDGSLEKSESDFIVASPKYGFLCLEVKGGSHMEITPEGKWILHTERYGPRDLDRSPYKQAEDSMYFFKDKYKKEYNIDYSGLFGAGAVFPFYALPQSESISNRDGICTIESHEMNNLSKKIKEMFKAWGGSRYGRNRYSQQEHEFFLDMVRKRAAMAAAAGALVKFKEKQLEEVNRVQDNYIYFVSNIRQFYVRGGAGTGKTWIALKMANIEAEKGGKALLTCKSVALANTLKGMAATNVDVYDLDTLRNSDLKGHYDAVFVDEAQDFSEEDAFNLKLFLKDEKQSRLGVFYDDVQKVRTETFGDSFMIDTPPFLLHENIRNTANIYKYATNETELGQDVITNPVEGPTPKTESIANKRKLTQRLNNLLKEYLVDEHLETSSMVILTDDLNGFMELFPEGIAKWKFVERPSESDEEIRVSSVADFKGLESDMVIYIHEKDISQNLNYIAYTRAKYYLLELVMQ